MVVNLKMQLESYSNDQLMHMLANEQESSTEMLQVARAIILERGLTLRNIMEHVNTISQAKEEARSMLKKDADMVQVVISIRDKYFLEEETARKIVAVAASQRNAASMLRCFRYFMLGFVIFYTVRIFAKIL